MTDDLLSGPRGRQFCMGVLTAARPEIWTLAARAAEYPQDPGLASELAEALRSPASVTAAESASGGALLAGLAQAVHAARYWQQPDETDALLAQPAIRLSLEPVAHALADALAAWWGPGLLDRDQQCFVQWTDERKGQPPVPGGAARKLADWKAAALADERQAAKRPENPEANWGGWWWSTPRPSELLTTTRGLPELGAIGLLLVEDSLGWKQATVWPLVPRPDSHVYEIDGPAAWTELAARYPMDVSLAKRHDWWRTTGIAGRWLVPDWSAVAADYDGVHLTLWGYLTTAGLALAAKPSAGPSSAVLERTVLAGWNPDETYWLNDVLTPGAAPSDWRSQGSGRWLRQR
ncbi:hypothetical protein [Arthrobacter sp. ISL-65]|uniref:hypothetical protein n=1 Tax=Arthrobacter sp. ISL-65 TaxID=2819112 RepID=UPI001BEB22A4|nr:hypothetical protein [Arthrobacter sp. ISL-65]MBT2550716.1 hypothetical protein [Arthrobacter sp. ISL-65]